MPTTTRLQFSLASIFVLTTLVAGVAAISAWDWFFLIPAAAVALLICVAIERTRAALAILPPNADRSPAVLSSLLIFVAALGMLTVTAAAVYVYLIFGFGRMFEQSTPRIIV